MNLQKIPLFTWVLVLSCDLLFLQSNQALRHGELLSREQVQFLTLGGQGDLADPDRKDLIQKVSTLLKVNISSHCCCCCCFCFAFFFGCLIMYRVWHILYSILFFTHCVCKLFVNIVNDCRITKRSLNEHQHQKQTYRQASTKTPEE